MEATFIIYLAGCITGLVIRGGDQQNGPWGSNRPSSGLWYFLFFVLLGSAVFLAKDLLR